MVLVGGRTSVGTATANNDSGGQKQCKWLSSGLQWGMMRADGERRWRQQSDDDGCGSKRQLRRAMTAKADNDSGGQQQHARLGGKLQRGRTRVGGKRRRRHGVAMMDAEAEDGGGGQRWWQTTTTAMADDNSGGRWRRRTMTAREIRQRTTRGKEESGRQTRTALDKRLISPP